MITDPRALILELREFLARGGYSKYANAFDLLAHDIWAADVDSYVKKHPEECNDRPEKTL